MRAEQKSDFLARYDSLTGLANRAYFRERLDEALRIRGDEQVAVLTLDLDRFRAVNDQYGQGKADQVLRAVGGMLEAAAGPHAVVARTGGDEFGLFIVGADAAVEAGRIGRHIRAKLEVPLELECCTVHVRGSMGIAVAPSDGEEQETLLNNAEIAMARAKKAGGGALRFFEAGMDTEARHRLELEDDVRAAVEADEIELHYQPVADVEHGRIIGFEALARWSPENRGFVPPDVLVEIAEENGLIVELGSKLLAKALREMAGWQSSLSLAVNVSPLQLFAPGFVPEVAELLNESGLAPERLVLEITEGVLIDDPKRALKVLAALKAMGVRIALDDFGTGYSSLRYFSTFPFDKIKIDKSFIGEMENHEPSRAVVRTVLGLAAGLGIAVVAEGVETEGQLAMLRGFGCPEVQGYLIGRPQPITHFHRTVIAPSGRDAPAAKAAS